uniref:Uncharacterized protein n=1 Tax=Myoviridae sp. ctpjm1 TaxID=2826699 RepID=A0A8S5NPA4_9CAUD|nr:MAG TPA: hypothetical protein [Myoviridae sp. ctpjm1]
MKPPLSARPPERWPPPPPPMRRFCALCRRAGPTASK